MILESLEIENFLNIDRLRLEFSDVSVLFGEDAGEVLQAIALLLAGSDALGEVLGSPEKWIREGCEQARIEGHFCEPLSRTVNLTLNRGETLRQVVRANDTSLCFADNRFFSVFGYGRHRRPSQSMHPKWFRHPEANAVATLFSPEATIKATRSPLDWAEDLLYRATIWDSLADAPHGICGILLLDEIELHLHPAIQQTLIETIRQDFPHLQVIATSLSPIVASTLRRSEALQTEGRTGGSPFGLSVGQVLAGHLFEMRSLRAPRFEEALTEVRQRATGGDPEAANQLTRMLALGEDWSK